MATKRQLIESFRDKLRERNADTTFTNQFLYNTLFEQARWLIRREVSAGRIYSNDSFFQTLQCVEVIEVSRIEDCCPVETNCKIYRTKNKIPDTWVDTAGPVIKSVTSVDGTMGFSYTTASGWITKREDPYQRQMDIKYAFFLDGYLWFPEHNPHRVNVQGFYVDDITNLDECDECTEEKPCVRFLDTKFPIPAWLEAEMLNKALEQLAGITKRMPADNEINKNDARR